MTERERLIELISDNLYLGGLEEKIADHLLSNGVIVPQINIGDSVYVPLNYDSIITAKVNSMTIYDRNLFVYTAYTEHFLKKFNFYETEIGKTVFLTREDADIRY